MKILNVRLGHACNSSSSHSLVFLPGVSDNYDGRQEFGWDAFTLASPEAKLSYLSQQIYHVLQHQLGEEVAYALAAGLTFVPPNRDGYVDHQSVWGGFPSKWDGTGVDMDFLVAFRDYMLKDGVVVLGGNDNDGEHPLSESAKELPLSYRELSYNKLVVRRDEGLGAWVMFDRARGTKIRISFDESVSPDSQVPHADLHKSEAPELVDVKVTDQCPYECEHCYQGSTKDAAHADRKFLNALLDDLAEQRVFEVAFGGGEPTVYPDFIGLLRETRDRLIVPNFTTRNVAFIKKHAQELKKYVGKIALSVDFADEIDAVIKHHLNGKQEPKAGSVLQLYTEGYERLVGLQHVVGAVPQADFERLVQFCKDNYLPLTLLGWKSTGRGDDSKRHAIDWKETLQRLEVRQVTIDTALARSSDMSGIDPETYHTTEGSVSCYVDAVERKVGPSSYSTSLLMKPYSKMSEDWKKVRVERAA
jgi:MoaA/NifB/PqqE/SkfB family radical SAM enzyme